MGQELHKTLEYALFLAAALFLTSILSIGSVLLDQQLLLQLGILSTITLMLIDTLVMYPAIKGNFFYLGHHILTIVGCIFALFHIESVFSMHIGILGYLTLGAAFRRVIKYMRKKKPQATQSIQTLYALQVFFDFCDLLILAAFWNFLSKLPTTVLISYLLLVACRYYINFQDLQKNLARKKPKELS